MNRLGGSSDCIGEDAAINGRLPEHFCCGETAERTQRRE